ncbi:MAG: cache domain-containing protein [Desulfosarcinaceae bacterium]|nr:cache domain-containing protein [Desulfosarcinaceae bacterium]
MIVICEECGKKYKVDLNKIRGTRANFKCSTCDHIIVVKKPSAPAAPKPQPPAPQTEAQFTPPAPADARPSQGQMIRPDAETAAKPAPTGVALREPGGKSGLGLVAKAVWIMLVVGIIPVGIFGWITLSQGEKRMRDDTKALIAEVTRGLSVHVDEWIDKNVRVLLAAANIGDIQSMEPQAQTEILKSIQQAYPWMYLVFTTDASGANIARNDGKALRDYSDRQYIKDIMGGKELAWQVLIGKTSKKPALVLAVPIKRNDQTVGVLANAMQLDDISKRIAAWKRGDTGYAFLVDERGKVVAHQLTDYVQEQKKLGMHPLIQSYTSGRSGFHHFKDVGGEEQIGHVRGTRYGWALAIQQSEAEAFADLYAAQRFAYTLLACTIIAVVLVAWLAGRALVQPIKRLTEAADRISVGDLDVEIEIHSRDEIAALGEAIARMQDSIRLSLERLRRRR